MELNQLIKWLRKQDQNLIVKDGFGEPHSDGGNYKDLAFDPAKETTIETMLKYAYSAVDRAFKGWEAGSFTMDGSSNVLIVEFGEEGEPITSFNFKYWLATAKNSLVSEIDQTKKEIEDVIDSYYEIVKHRTVIDAKPIRYIDKDKNVTVIYTEYVIYLYLDDELCVFAYGRPTLELEFRLKEIVSHSDFHLRILSEYRGSLY